MGFVEGGDFSIMVDYPDLSSLSDNPNIGDFLSLPNASYPFFWAWIIGGLWLIITFSLYFGEKEKKISESLLASMAVSCFAIIVVSVLGSIVGFISLEIMVYILVFSIGIIAVWLFTTKRS